MTHTCRVRLVQTALIALVILSGSDAFTQSGAVPSDSYPNPYRMVENPLTLPEGRALGFVMGIDVDRNGEDIWVMDTCGGGGDLQACVTTHVDVDPIMKFDASGRFLSSFGAGMIAHPHGLYIDPTGNIWIVDGFGGTEEHPTKGHQVFKFSPEGERLLALGTAGVRGKTESTFNTPSDVVVAANGDIFVADGHADDMRGYATNQRIVKFDKDGTFLTAWGTNGSGPREFGESHSLAIDAQGRLFVADRRDNHRIQIFDQDGNFLDAWKQFGSPSELFINRQDVMYVADALHPELEHGIYVGSARDGTVTAFIPDVSDNLMQELVVADANGNLWAGFTTGRMIRKYEKR